MLFHLLGNEHNDFVDFYLNYQPTALPRLACNCTFLENIADGKYTDLEKLITY